MELCRLNGLGSTLTQDARLRHKLGRALAKADKLRELLTLLCAQPNHVFLDGDLFPSHESPPAPLRSDRDSELTIKSNDGDY